MNTAARMSVFGLALAVVFGGGWAIGRVIGPDGVDGGTAVPSEAAHGTGHGAAEVSSALPGLASTQNGYTLAAQTARLEAGVPEVFRFRIVDGSSAPVTRFAAEHDKLLHLVMVRRDGIDYQHVHPELAADGTWSVPLTLPAAGSYRVFADFRPEGGPKTTLGIDVQVAGEYRPEPASGERRTSTVDGYTVTLDGSLTAGASAQLTASVASGGQPVTDLQPYLAAYGHLVALRDGDLAYLHVHPDGAPGDGRTSAGPRVGFAVEVPSAGRYLLFLDFQHRGVVHTASFVLEAAGQQPNGGHGG